MTSSVDLYWILCRSQGKNMFSKSVFLFMSCQIPPSHSLIFFHLSTTVIIQWFKYERIPDLLQTWLNIINASPQHICLMHLCTVNCLHLQCNIITLNLARNICFICSLDKACNSDWHILHHAVYLSHCNLLSTE